MRSSIFLRTRLLLLLLPESKQGDTRDLDDLETDTGNITLGLTLATETGEQNLVVLIDEVQATVIGDCKNMPVSICLWWLCWWFHLVVIPTRVGPNNSSKEEDNPPKAATFLPFLMS